MIDVIERVEAMPINGPSRRAVGPRDYKPASGVAALLGAKVGLSADQVIATANATAIVLANTLFDTDSLADGTGLTLKANSYYLVGATLWLDFSSTATPAFIELDLKDGSGNPIHQALLVPDNAVTANKFYTVPMVFPYHTSTSPLAPRLFLTCKNVSNVTIGVTVGQNSQGNSFLWAYKIG